MAMHEISKIEDQDIRFLIASLRTIYATQFNKSFPQEGKNAMPMQMVEQIAKNTLVGVRKNQFDHLIQLHLIYPDQDLYQ